MERSASNMAEAKLYASAFLRKPLVNTDTGITAIVSGNNLNKMTSESALRKSADSLSHSVAIANLDHLFKHATLIESHADKRGEPTIIAIHRFYAPMIVNSKVLVVKMTVKETQSEKNPNPLYTVESLDLDRGTPAGLLATESTNEGGPRNAPIAGVNLKLRKLLAAVNPKAVNKKAIDENGEPRIFEPSVSHNTISAVDFNSLLDRATKGERVQLPSLSQRILSLVKKFNKPLILKPEIAAKNLKHHPEISTEESARILKNALYNTKEAIQTDPKKAPNYWLLSAPSGPRTDNVVVELSETKDGFEIVGWYSMRQSSVNQKKRKAEREGGQVLIIALGDSAGLSEGSLSD